MKKILFAAVAALAIVGCTQNEEFDNLGSKAEIKVGTVVKATTKAAVTDNTALQGTGFTVYAYNTGEKTIDKVIAAGDLGTPFMDGVLATYGNNVWTLADGPHYWPLNSNVQFFAYATDAAATDYKIAVDEIFPSLTYRVDADAAKQKDFVVAKLTDQTKTSNAVKLSFTHALTQVNFSAKGKNENLKYTITSIAIQGVANTGTYSFADGTWEATGTEVYTYPTATDAVVTGADYKALDQDNGALMLMPQAMTANSKIKLSYKVYSVATVDGKVVETLIDEITDSLIELDKSAAWEAGKKVRYNLTLSSEGATVGFTTEVGPWSTTDDTTVEK